MQIFPCALHEDIWGWRYNSPHFLNATLDGDQRSASRSDRFTSWERPRCTHRTGGWVDHSTPCHSEEEQVFLHLPGIVARVLLRPAHGLVAVSTFLSSSLK